MGAMAPLETPFVEWLKYLRSICGEIIGSANEGGAAGKGALVFAWALVLANGVGGRKQPRLLSD